MLGEPSLAAVVAATREPRPPSGTFWPPPGSGRPCWPRGRRIAGRRRAPAGRCSPSPRPGARPRTWPPRCAASCRRTPVAEFPAWETLPHERLSPAQRHRRPPARRAAPAGAPRRRRPGTPGPLRSWSRRCARVLQPHGPRAWATWSRSRCGRRRGRPRRRRRAAGRRRLHPGRHGRAARRVRRPRRHPRRVPADRGAPAAGRVLGRHGRGDPLVRRRRPAQPRGRAGRAVGAAVPRAAAHRRRSGRGRPRWPTGCPGLADMLGQARRGHRGRGHGVAGPGAGRRRWSCWSTCCPAGTHRGRVRPGAGPRPGRTTWSRPARSSWQASWANAAAGSAPRSTSASRRSAPRRYWPWPTCAAAPRRPAGAVVDRSRRSPADDRGAPTAGDGPADGAGCPRCHRAAVGYRGDTERRWPTSRPGCATAGGWSSSPRATVRPQRDGRGARRRDVPARLVDRAGRRAGAGRRARHHGPGSEHGFVADRLRLAVLTEADLTGRPASAHPGHAPDAEPAAQRRRPAAAAAGRLRGARAARRRPVRGDGAAHRRPAPPASTW